MDKRKNLFIFVFLCCVMASCSSDYFDSNLDGVDTSDEFFISQEDALQIAGGNGLKDYLNLPCTRSTGEPKIKEIKAIPDFNNKTAFYIINYDEGGFLLLSADKRVNPILAHSNNGLFLTEADDMPEGLTDWMLREKSRITQVRNLDSKMSDQNVMVWSSLILDDGEKFGMTRALDPGTTDDGDCGSVTRTYGPLISTKWHQEEPFNDLMPLATYERRAPAGCATIAMAQVMKFHQHPTNFSWSSMNDFTATTATKQLISDIFGRVIYYFDATQASSNLTQVLDALVYSYNYHLSASICNFSLHDVKTEIAQNRPVIMRGGNNFGPGHIWVCAGYEETFSPCGYFPTYYMLNMNWGWGGQFDGYFYEDDESEPMGQYYLDRQMIKNLRKPNN